MRTVPALTHFPPGLLPLMVSFLGAQFAFVMGGDDTLKKVHRYSIDANSWDTIAQPISDSRHLQAVIGRRIFLMADPSETAIGVRIHLISDACEAFDLNVNRWCPIPSPSTPFPSPHLLWGCCTTHWCGRLFVFGGYGCATASYYDPIRNAWSSIASMTVDRSSAAVATIPGYGILVSGGLSVQSVQQDDSLQSAELYDPTTDSWTVMPWTLPTPLRYHVSHYCSTSGLLCMIGGYSTTPTDKCWALDFHADSPSWTPLCSLPYPLHGMASVLV